MVQSRHALAKDVLLADQYRIDTVLGAGGFGITYMAQDMGLGSEVVMKEYFPAQIAVRDQTATVHPHSDRELPIFEWGRDRFVREARILDSCRHAHIVRVRRVFETNNTAYMALDFEDGPNLEAWLKALGRPPTQGELDAIVWPLLDALAYLHHLPQPVIHRDIAPDNIIMRGGNHPVLIDFGAAKVETVGRTESRVGAVKDGYSPREQYSQKAELQGPWTDIYAMAATIRRAITGERPPDSMGRDLDDTMQPLAAMPLEGYRPTFLAAIDEAMQVRHTVRPQTVDEWRDLLFDGEPQPAPRSRPGRRSPSTSASGPPVEDSAKSAARQTAPAHRPRAADEAVPAGFVLQPAPARGGGTRRALLGLAAIVVLGGGMAMAQYWRKSAQPVAVVAPTEPVVANRANPAASIQHVTPPLANPQPGSTATTQSPETQAAVTQAPVTQPVPAAPATSTQPAAPARPAAQQDPASVAFQQAQECRRLAQPPARNVTGVLFEDLDGAAATTACDAAVRAVPENTRLETLLGRALAKTANYGAARQWLERAARKGDNYALFHLGVLYMDGQGVRRDFVKAREWFEQAVALDEPHAMNTLGVLHENGRGVPVDLVKAKEWYEKALAAGNVAAAYNLGQMLTNGRGVPQDHVLAKAFFEQAATRNFPSALNSLGFAHETGRGVAQDYVKAREFYERAAARNSGVSMNNLGLIYENGRGVQQDYVKAREWYEKAAERGNGRGMLHLGILYSNGRGVTQDLAVARAWYEKAVERSESGAMHNLALFLDQGRGGATDYTRAATLLLQASRSGSTNATTTLAGTMARWNVETVRAVQTTLQASGFYKGAINGAWDAAGQAAAKQYAEART